MKRKKKNRGKKKTETEKKLKVATFTAIKEENEILYDHQRKGERKKIGEINEELDKIIT